MSQQHQNNQSQFNQGQNNQPQYQGQHQYQPPNQSNQSPNYSQSNTNQQQNYNQQYQGSNNQQYSQQQYNQPQPSTLNSTQNNQTQSNQLNQSQKPQTNQNQSNLGYQSNSNQYSQGQTSYGQAQSNQPNQGQSTQWQSSSQGQQGAQSSPSKQGQGQSNQYGQTQSNSLSQNQSNYNPQGPQSNSFQQGSSSQWNSNNQGQGQGQGQGQSQFNQSNPSQWQSNQGLQGQSSSSQSNQGQFNNQSNQFQQGTSNQSQQQIQNNQSQKGQQIQQNNFQNQQGQGQQNQQNQPQKLQLQGPQPPTQNNKNSGQPQGTKLAQQGSPTKNLDQGEPNQDEVKQLSGKQLLNFIKKKPHSQQIGNTEYTYSILNKKQKSFVGTNLRFLYLKGIQSLCYARTFDQKIPLPFTEQSQIPAAKSTYILSQIQSVTNEQDKLVINFKGEDDKIKQKWQFACPSKDCALKWRKKIQNSKKDAQDFKVSGYANYDQFLKFKYANAQMQQANLDNFLGNNQNPSLTLNNPTTLQSSQNQGLSNFQNNQFNSNSLGGQNVQNNQSNFSSNLNNSAHNQSNLSSSLNNPNSNNLKFNSGINQQNSQKSQFNTNNNSFNNNQFNNNSQFNNNNQFNNNQPSNFNNFNSNQNPNRPNTVQFQGPQASKIDNFILDRTPEQKYNLNQSMSRIPYEQKQGIKGDIRRSKRNWIEQLVGGQQQVELIIDFKNYVQKIAQVIINQLYNTQQSRLYPATDSSKEYATYHIDDIYIEIYFMSQQNLSSKHPRYQQSLQQFKNFQYLINATKNDSILKVPFMTLFEYKGFLGMGKTKFDNKPLQNKQFFNFIDRKQFENKTRISSQILLNQNKCKIISYQRSKLSNQYNRVYFIQKLIDFLPLENSKQFGPSNDKFLRSQLISDQQFDQQVFRDRVKLVKNQKINNLIQNKITQFIRVLEFQQNYFTNSHQLSELLHLYGINIRYLGLILRKTKLRWLRKIFHAEIAARCIKNYFRYDIQNSVLQNYNQDNRRQQQRQRSRVIGFLNTVFGNTQPTFRLWRNLNSAATQKYHVKIWDNQFTDINTGYLLQAVLSHLKITLSKQSLDRILQRQAGIKDQSNPNVPRLFKSTNNFDYRDFIRFDFNYRIYDLSFTTIFQNIEQSLEDQTLDSFQYLCQILTKETSNGVSYLDLLKDHSIHDRISQFLLYFTSPQDNNDLYNKIQSKYLPHKFLFQGKLAEVKWYLKGNKQDFINRITNFILESIKKWLGQAHPLTVQLYRLLAQYYSEMQFYFSKALQLANDSLKLQRSLFEGDSQPIWRDYNLVGKIYYINNRPQEALSYLTKAKSLVIVDKLNQYQAYGELCLMLSKGYITSKYYKQAYTTVRELYKTIKQLRDQRSLGFIVEAVTLIKQLLEINQQHESYYKFVQSDFSNIVHAFADYPNLMIQSIKMITIPYLKNVILRNSKNKVKLLSIIEQVSKIKQSSQSCQTYIKAKISQGSFPKSYLHCLKEIDNVVEEILANQMIQRWKSFNNLANQSILDKIGNSQINRGFDFLANMTALFNLLGSEVLQELFIMQK